MSDNYSFEDELRKFQGKLTEEWRNYSKQNSFEQKIAVSIQIHDQDKQVRLHSCASDQEVQAVNNYCKNILNKSVNAKEKCDDLETSLKDKCRQLVRLFAKGFVCRCHADVSNAVVPFKDGDRTWYIFFGQFLLKAGVPAVEDAMLKGSSIVPILKPEDQYGDTVKAHQLIADLNNPPFNGTDISLVGLPDFLAFKCYVLAKFEEFINDVKSDNDKLKSLNRYESAMSVARLGEYCSALESTSCHYGSPSEIAATITKIRNAANAKTTPVPEKTKYKCIEWLTLGLSGHFLNREWQEAGGHLFEESDSKLPSDVGQPWRFFSTLPSDNFVPLGIFFALGATYGAALNQNRPNIIWYWALLLMISMVMFLLVLARFYECWRDSEEASNNRNTNSVKTTKTQYFANDIYARLSTTDLLKRLSATLLLSFCFFLWAYGSPIV